jgi:hypothetical protein
MRTTEDHRHGVGCALDAGTPRILVDGGAGMRPNKMASSITIMPYMMDAGEEKIVAEAIYEGLTKPGHYDDPVVPQASHRRSMVSGLSRSTICGARVSSNSFCRRPGTT